jgi:hypothetical protein
MFSPQVSLETKERISAVKARAMFLSREQYVNFATFSNYLFSVFGMQFWCAVLVCSVGVQCWCAVLVCSVGVQCWYAVFVCSVGVQCWYAVLVCSVGVQCWCAVLT